MELRDELNEVAERAHKTGERQIGLTTAIVAVFLALTTMLGHRAHTEEAVLQTRTADQWAFYQAKNVRSHLYAADARLAALAGVQGAATAQSFQQESIQQRQDADKIAEQARDLEKDVERASRRAGYFNISEIFLEIAIVLCSISLLSQSRTYWAVSFFSTAAGIVLLIIGWFH